MSTWPTGTAKTKTKVASVLTTPPRTKTYMEGEWHDVFVTSYDEDGSAWFKGLGNGNSDTLNLFFEDLEFHELPFAKRTVAAPITSLLWVLAASARKN